MLNEFFPLIFVFAIAVLLPAVIVGATFVLGPQKKTEEKFTVYESGMTPQKDSRVKFNIRFFLIAMIFIVFDIELVFMYPWAVTFKEFLNAGYTVIYWEMLTFIGILLIGYLYVWKKGALKWD